MNRTKYAQGFEDAPIVLMDRVKNIAGAYIHRRALAQSPIALTPIAANVTQRRVATLRRLRTILA